MTIKEIIDGLQFTVDMFLFDPSTGETYPEPRNSMDKITIDSCKGAIELLEQKRWIPCSERMPENGVEVFVYINDEAELAWWNGNEWETSRFYLVGEKTWPKYWMPLPKPYDPQESEG